MTEASHQTMSLENRIPPPIVALGCGALIYLLRDHFRVQFAGQAYVAAVVLAVSLAVILLALLEFRRAQTTSNPLKPDTASVLVQSGVFSVSRNPMYLGLFGILVAWVVFLGATAGIVGLAMFVVWMNRFQIRPEERAMAALFDDDFVRYKSRVRRWL